MNRRKLMLGNEAIAQGLAENGCTVATSYPGTPASEILSSLAALKKATGVPAHVQWAINEKVAFEIAYAAGMSGLRSSVSMKQVGLNVASDPLMSAAYMGTRGGFVIISADDPGPHSSQTEQDSRLMAMMAKIPVLDPDSPAQAREMTAVAYEISEAFQIPVMLRPTTRVCHSRQDILPGKIQPAEAKADFRKDPRRWAATPKFRYQLHQQLERKLSDIAGFEKTAPVRLNPEAVSTRAVVVSGVCAAYAREVMQNSGLLETIPLFQVLQPYPLHSAFIADLIQHYEQILVIEETEPVIEMQIADRHRVKGKMNGAVPGVGELLPEKIQEIIGAFAGIEIQTCRLSDVPGRRPTLCAGCPHRASFFAIKRAVPKGIYTGDIGCYTLGMNLGAVDTVLCMGAAVSQAAGFYHAYKRQPNRPDIVAAIGDSTFFHAGIPALVDAVAQNVRFVLVILDNSTTAMTGNQPTPATGTGACGEPLTPVAIDQIVRGCGVKFCREADPYHLDEFISLVKEAVAFSRENGPAVVISKHPCLIHGRGIPEDEAVEVEVSEICDGCGYCVRQFECPALILEEDDSRVTIDPISCSRCGICLSVCPKHALIRKKR